MDKTLISLIAGGILFIVSTYIGMVIRKHYKKRRDFFRDFDEFLTMLENEVSFLKTPLKTIISNFSAEKKGEFVKFLEGYSTLMDSGTPLTYDNIKKKAGLGFLKQPEADYVFQFFTGLGKTDAKTQLLEIKKTMAKNSDCLAKAEKDFKNNGALAYKLGILLGLAVMIFVA